MDFIEKIKESITENLIKYDYDYKKVIFIVYIVFACIIILIIWYYINKRNGINSIDKSLIVYLHPGLDTRKNKYGLGVYTNQDISANTIILKEKLYFLDKEPVTDFNVYRMKMIKKMLNENKTYLLNLIPHKLDDTMQNTYDYNDISHLHLQYLPELDVDTLILYLHKITRNAFNYIDYYIDAFVFYGTKLNHSCDANVYYEQNKEDDTIIFTTTKDIKAGEELFISYIDYNMCKCNRQLQLKENYGFDCECEKCKTTKYCAEESHVQR